MPAAAVIPAPIAYIKVVAVKKLVVGFLLESDGAHLVRYLNGFGILAVLAVRLIACGRGRDFYFEEIRVFTAGKRLEYISME